MVSIFNPVSDTKWCTSNSIGFDHWYSSRTLVYLVVRILEDVGDRREMIVRGWEKCGLTRPFERSFQAEAMEANTLGLLFDSKDNSSIEEELIHDAELEELFEDEDIAELMAKCIM
jgi:hypothetical protein